MSNAYDVLCPFCRHVNRSTAKFCQTCGQDIILNNDKPGNDDRRYHITRIIKTGGQGSVYAGVDQDGKVYAIKEMLDDYATSAERDDSLRRFNAEAELLQGLHHPRIPRIYSHFTDEGRHYLTMDLVQGEDLEEIIEREGSLPEHVVLQWADQVCDVLAYLHSQGLIYRDMKPSNIMIEQDGNIKLIDFGIAKVFVPHKQGTLIGTPGYSPPEQYQGLATTLSDIYALGATLHHLLTGRDPTQHQPFSFEAPQRLNPAISSRTNAAIIQALSFKPEDRFETVVEFRSMLRPLPGTSGLLPPTSQSTVVLPRGGGQQPTAQPHTQAPLSSPTGATQQQTTGSVASAQAAPQRKPKRKKKRSSCVVWVVAMLLILGGVGYFGVTLFYQQVQQYIPLPAATSSVPPTPASTPLPLPTGFVTLDIETQVAAGADEQTIQEAFLVACEQKVQQDYGQDVRIQRPYTTFVAGDAPGSGQWTEVATQGNMVVYRATMQTMLYRP
jgi:serine/threonine-protein kinase